MQKLHKIALLTAGTRVYSTHPFETSPPPPPPVVSKWRVYWTPRSQRTLSRQPGGLISKGCARPHPHPIPIPFPLRSHNPYIRDKPSHIFLESGQVGKFQAIPNTLCPALCSLRLNNFSNWNWTSHNLVWVWLILLWFHNFVGQACQVLSSAVQYYARPKLLKTQVINQYKATLKSHNLFMVVINVNS